MARLSFLSRFCVFVFVFCRSAVEPAPHIPGGPWNTDLDDIVNSNLIPGVLNSVFSEVVSGLHDNHQTNTDTDISTSHDINNNEISSDIIDHSTDQILNTDIHITGSNRSPAQITGERNSNSLIRKKRQACPNATESDLSFLLLSLNSTVYLRRDLNQPPEPIVASDEPTECPSANNSWWPKEKENLRSTCPWNYTKVNLGENSYPR
jgi:hypothetical protein